MSLSLTFKLNGETLKAPRLNSALAHQMAYEGWSFLKLSAGGAGVWFKNSFDQSHIDYKAYMNTDRVIAHTMPPV